MLLMESLWKYRWWVSGIFFVVLTFLLIWLFGDVSCRDGWGSSSIGRQGACSHHGGVKSNIGLLFLISFLGVFFFSAWFHKLYEERFGCIVCTKVPRHPMERELSSLKPYVYINQATGCIRSRIGFQCFLCENNFLKGTEYAAQNQFGKRNKFCLSCSQEIPLVNEMRANSINLKRQSLFKEINNYYENEANK